jgi:MFS family permease
MIRGITRPLKIIYLILFIYFLQNSFAMYINSSFLSDGCGCGISEKTVGLIFTVAAILTLILLSELPTLARRYGNHIVLIALLASNGLTLLGLVFIREATLLSFIMMAYLSLHAVIMMSFDIFIEEYSDTEHIGDVRGIFTTLVHIGMAGAVFTAGYLADQAEGYRIIYIIGVGLSATALTLLLTYRNIFRDPVIEVKQTIFHSIKKFWSNPDLRRIFMSGFLLQLFYAIMVIYTPMYLHHHIGLPWDKIGIIIGLILVPFILFAIPLGDIADRKYGEKKILAIGFVTVAIFTGAMAFLKTDVWWVWALILFGTRLGAMAVQVMTETFFFRHVKENELGLMSIFRDAYPAAYIVAPLLATLILSTFNVPLRFLFLVLGVGLLTGLYYSLNLHDKR